MKVNMINKSEVKSIVKELVVKRFQRIEAELFGFRRTIRRLQEEIICLKNFKNKGGKNRN